jgi:hypothetical protein
MSIDDDNNDITLANDLVESVVRAMSHDDRAELNFRKWLSDHYPPHQVLQILDQLARVLR